MIIDLKGLTLSSNQKVADVNITGLTSDSREVRPGYIFAALKGAKLDGRDYIEAAIARGAVAILAPEGTILENKNIVLLTDKNPRKCFSKMAAQFFGRQMNTIVAVTGTNGKSSTVNFCRQLWQSMEHAAASLGTIGITANLVGGGNIDRPGMLITPDPVVLHSEIAELEAAGVTHLAFEASSIGLDQYRLDGVRITAAGFTNLTRDHLDYHGTMEKYFESKLRLFTEVLVEDGVAVIYMDSPYSDRVKEACQLRGLKIIEVGKRALDIRLKRHKALPTGQFIELSVFGESYALEMPLVGEFQVMNALLALGLVLASDPLNKLLHMQGVYALERLQSVRGRLEYAAKHPNGAAIYVDYAHTPDGIETLLHSLKPHAEKRLHIVFGCGGDRDRGKRPMMGEIAARLADVVIITDDNPRTEDASMIRTEVMKGAGSKAHEIAGRKTAIQIAIEGLEPDDILVIAGKGHEQGQIIGTEILPFDDVTEVKKVVLEMAK